MNEITPCILLRGTAEQAAEFYVALFDSSHIARVTRWPDGRFLAADIVIMGRSFVFLNEGLDVAPNAAISLTVYCRTQDEIDRYWDALTAEGGQPLQCGWLTDRFGLTWQVVPEDMPGWMAEGDPERTRRVMNAFMPMTKLDLATLRRAAEGRA